MTHRQHITVAALLNLLLGLLSVAAGVLIEGARAGWAPVRPFAPERFMLALQVFFLADGLLRLGVAWGIYHLRPWARVLGIVFGALALTTPVVGVAFGVYTLWALLSEGGAYEFRKAGQVHLFTDTVGFGGAATRGPVDERPPPCSCLLLVGAWALIHVLFAAPLMVMLGPDPRAWPRPQLPTEPAPPGATEGAPGQPRPPTRARRMRPVDGLPGHYSYIDDEGKAHIVDDVEKVPERYR